MKTAMTADAKIASVVDAGGWMAGFTGSLSRSVILPERAARWPGNSAPYGARDDNVGREDGVPALELTVNGTKRRTEADPDETLLAVLRDRLDLTGTKYGCGEGQCGACTVLLDGRPARACLTPAAGAVGKAITTIEGLE